MDAATLTPRSVSDSIETLREMRQRLGETRQRAQIACRRSQQVIERCNDLAQNINLPARSTSRLLPTSPDAETTDRGRQLAEALEEIDHLRAALATRDLIWKAKLIIAASTGYGPEESHRLLVQQSQHENRKLRDVAAEIVERSPA